MDQESQVKYTEFPRAMPKHRAAQGGQTSLSQHRAGLPVELPIAVTVHQKHQWGKQLVSNMLPGWRPQTHFILRNPQAS